MNLRDRIRNEMVKNEISDLTHQFLNRKFGEPKEEYDTYEKAYKKIEKLKKQLGG